MERLVTFSLLLTLAVVIVLPSGSAANGRVWIAQETGQPKIDTDWKEYEGRYEVNPHQLYNFVVDIAVENKNLSARLSHRQRRVFSFKAVDEFLDQETRRITLTFVRNGEHKIAGLKIHDVSMTYYFDEMHNVTSRMISGRVELTARKIELPPPSLTGNTTFTLKGFSNARIVALAGSFNHWNQSETLLAKEDDHWICRIDLPAGKYPYKFVVDGAWILDPDNDRTEDDGLGNLNSIREIK